MKEFIKAIKLVIIYQFICWGTFILCDENKFILQSTVSGIAIVSGILLLISILILYFVFINKFIEKNNLNSVKFKTFLFILWVIFSIVISSIFVNLITNGYFHICQTTGWDCFLNGFEYFLYGIFMVLLVILILIIKLIIVFYQRIVKSEN